MPTQIRPEVASDRLGISAVHRRAFPTDAEARLVDALRSAGHLSLSLVAIEAGAIAGHIAFSPVSLETSTETIVGQGLAPVAVLPAAQRRGIGSKLIREGLDRCQLMGAPFVVVLGEPSYYRRFGFKPAHERGIGNEYGAHDEFMCIELIQGGIPRGQGIARYAREFALVS